MKSLLMIVLLSILLCGCANAHSQLGWAFIQSTSEPVTATEFEGNSKIAKVCGLNILGFISYGDFSIERAKFQARIKKVSSVDSTVAGVSGIVVRKCTIVTGE